MRKAFLLLSALLLMAGCARRASRSYYSLHNRWVDVDVRKGSVDVNVERDESDDVDVHVAWP